MPIDAINIIGTLAATGVAGYLGFLAGRIRPRESIEEWKTRYARAIERRDELQGDLEFAVSRIAEHTKFDADRKTATLRIVNDLLLACGVTKEDCFAWVRKDQEEKAKAAAQQQAAAAAQDPRLATQKQKFQAVKDHDSDWPWPGEDWVQYQCRMSSNRVR